MKKIEIVFKDAPKIQECFALGWKQRVPTQKIDIKSRINMGMMGHMWGGCESDTEDDEIAMISKTTVQGEGY